MATTEDLLALARRGSPAWNLWRVEHHGEKVDFSGVDFTSPENESISFAGFEFGDDARFDGARFGDEVQFEGASFGYEARFDGSSFGEFARFDGASFKDTAQFSRVRFGDQAQFNGARFGDGAQFNGACFRDQARFDGARFGNGVQFDGASFGKNTQFGRAYFGEGAWFKGARFGEWAMFAGARFEGPAWFEEARFGNDARFDEARFGEGVWFDGARFGDRARFNGASFGYGASFKGAMFEGAAFFDGASQGQIPTQPLEASGNGAPSPAQTTDSPSGLPEAGTNFGVISFSHAWFLGPATFKNRAFLDEADFSAVRFDTPPDFRGTKGRENLDWTGVRFAIGKFPFRGWTANSDTIARLRRLRGIAAEIHAHDAERDLFILEHQAERGVLCSEWLRGDWRTRLTSWWRPLSATLLMLLYRWSSDCGRSAMLPLAWLAAANVGFYFLYAHLYVSLIGRPLDDLAEKALQDVTIASAVPFGATAKPAFEAAVKLLFKLAEPDIVDIPWQIQFASATQGIVNLILVFLLGLALRNHFKVK